jgi:hypothetical protein
VKTGFGGMDGKYDIQPDFVFDTLRSAVESILRQDQ